MAIGSLNLFKTVTAQATTSETVIYTAPTLYTSIIMLAHISNISDTTANVTFSHVGNGTTTELLKNFSVPKNDAVAAITGKLILEEGQSVKISSDQNNKLKIILSILETANE